MANRNGQRGAKAERDLVVWLRSNGFPDACRARGEGAADRGDIGGIPGVCVQVKNAAKHGYVLARLRAAQHGALHQAYGRLAVAVVRPPGVTDPGQWLASVPPPAPAWSSACRPLLLPNRVGVHELYESIKERRWVVRGDWFVTTVQDLFGELR